MPLDNVSSKYTKYFLAVLSVLICDLCRNACKNICFISKLSICNVIWNGRTSTQLTNPFDCIHMGNMQIHKLEASSNLSSKTKNRMLSVYVQRKINLNPVSNIMQPTPNFHALIFTLIMLFSVVNLRGSVWSSLLNLMYFPAELNRCLSWIAWWTPWWAFLNMQENLKPREIFTRQFYMYIHWKKENKTPHWREHNQCSTPPLS